MTYSTDNLIMVGEMSLAGLAAIDALGIQVLIV